MCKVESSHQHCQFDLKMWNVQVYPFYYLNRRYRKLYNRVPIEKQKKTHLPDSDFYSCSTSAETPKHRHTNTLRQTDSRTHILESMKSWKMSCFLAYLKSEHKLSGLLKKRSISCSVMPDSSTPCMDCSLPGSSVHGILQDRIWEWVAISFSRGIFLSRLLHCRHVLYYLSHQWLLI